jgi:protein-S-isoprenylcysteine O-methyltransferase Ste14
MEKILIDGVRIWFLILYSIGIVALLVKFIPAHTHEEVIEKRIKDSRRLLPIICLPIDWLVPPLILLWGFGGIQAAWPLLRIIGFGLSLYALVILVWVPRALGRFLVPQAVVFPDHELVTSGPFRFVRHPSFSGALALWLGAALGNLDWLLLGLWFPLVLAKTMQAGAEEEILRAKFGKAYEEYNRQTGRFIPKFCRG